jgi:hypothetical protein
MSVFGAVLSEIWLCLWHVCVPGAAGAHAVGPRAGGGVGAEWQWLGGSGTHRWKEEIEAVRMVVE